MEKIIFVLCGLALILISGCATTDTKKIAKKEKANKYEFFRNASRLTPPEAAKLDKQVDAEPENMKAAAMWLVYYTPKMFKDAKIKQKRTRILLSIIEKDPENEVFSAVGAYAGYCLYRDEANKTIKLWKKQLEKDPDNLKILSNAAGSVRFMDYDFSVKCLKKGQKLDPDNPDWAKKLAFLYFLRSKREKDKDALNSYEEYKKVYRQTKTPIPDIGRAAYLAGKYKEAEELAEKTLAYGKNSSSEWRKAHYMYNAYALLGLLALKENNIEKACKYLSESKKVILLKPRISLDMSLACLLTYKKQDKCVLDFLETAAKSDKSYEQYIKDIKAGIMPKYGMLLYSKSLYGKIYAARRRGFLDKGKALTVKQAAALEKEVASVPEKQISKARDDIAILFGYYYSRLGKDESVKEKRRQLLFRVLKYDPHYPLLTYPETWLRSGKDEKLIELCKANLAKYPPEDSCIRHKAYHQLITHDDKLAKECYEAVRKGKVDDASWAKIAAKINARYKAK
jgi:hypothetical protein